MSTEILLCRMEFFSQLNQLIKLNISFQEGKMDVSVFCVFAAFSGNKYLSSAQFRNMSKLIPEYTLPMLLLFPLWKFDFLNLRH